MATKKKQPEAAVKAKVESKFSKEQLIASERFRDRRDLLTAILPADGRFTLNEVDQMIEKFMKGKVK